MTIEFADDSPFITQERLAGRWGISTATLERDRSFKKGPKYLKIGGMIRYRVADIVEYENACEVQTKGKLK